jgi:hypothetical protein
MELGEQPEPSVEPAEPPPGGVDAITETAYDAPPVVPDLTGVGNTATRDDLPGDLQDADETDEGASSDGASEPEKESPA